MKTFYVVYEAGAGDGEETYLCADRQEAIAEAETYADELAFIDSDEDVEVIVAELVPVTRVIRRTECTVEDIQRTDRLVPPSMYGAGVGVEGR